MNYAHSIPETLQERAKADLPPLALKSEANEIAVEPSHAERVRTLVHSCQQGLLSTICREPKGFPFGSLVKHAARSDGHILLCLSDLAEHTKNLGLDNRSSVMVTESTGPGADPLALGRVTLLGPLNRLRGKEEDKARSEYLEVYPGAYFAEFSDFHLYLLEVTDIRYVGGFGKMSWVHLSDYLAASPDPLWPHANRIVEHMNQDHPEALVAYSRTFGSLPDASEAKMTAVDRYGFDLSSTDPEGERSLRLGFGQSLSTPDEVRKKMVAMLEIARQGS